MAAIPSADFTRLLVFLQPLLLPIWAVGHWTRDFFINQWRIFMTSKSKLATAIIVSAVISGAAVHGLHAQGKSSKAYTVTELQTLDAKLAADVAGRITKAQESAGGRNLKTGGGKVTAMEGPPPPQRVTITEWDSLEKAQAFFKSKAWNDLTPDRDKALKTIRRYAVEER
jgi:uncharacterized protein (DUF1330 family)